MLQEKTQSSFYITSPSGEFFANPFFLVASLCSAKLAYREKSADSNLCVTVKNGVNSETAEGCKGLGARYRVGSLEMWISPDPARQFFSGYAYAGNETNPINFKDPNGLTIASNWAFLTSWFKGDGASARSYEDKDIETKELAKAPQGQHLKEAFEKNGNKDVSNVEYGTIRAYLETAWRVNSTGAQVGGYGGASAKNNGDGTVTYTIPNDAGTHSFWLHAVPNRECTNCSMRTIQQTFKWTEVIPK